MRLPHSLRSFAMTFVLANSKLSAMTMLVKRRSYEQFKAFTSILVSSEPSEVKQSKMQARQGERVFLDNLAGKTAEIRTRQGALKARTKVRN